MLKKILTFAIPLLFLILPDLVLISKETGINKIPVFDYVTGRFDPSNNPEFVNIKKAGIPCSDIMYLRKETALSLKLMLEAFKKEHPKVHIEVISATRNFTSQKKIWEEKWSGKRKVSGKPDFAKIQDPLMRATAILEYSSMPGTSRHHWGTDFDINRLNNSWYEKGDGKIILDWLNQNASKYGFARPYTDGRIEGYKEERWHWSYTPLSKIYLAEWNRIFGKDPSLFNKKGIFSGSEKSGHLAPVYVNSINPDCK